MTGSPIELGEGQVANTRVFIDNPWEEVERTIHDVAEDELCDPEGGRAAEEWADEIATRIASRVMMHMDGGEHEIDKHGLRGRPA